MEVKIEVKPRLINANALMEYCRNQKNKTVDCNDIARFPTYPTQETEKDVIINFLKKELQKKTYCRQVMKRQYRELKQKYNAKKDYVHISEIIPYTQSLVIPLLKKHLEEQNQIFCSGKDTKICEEAKFQINMTLAVLEKIIGNEGGNGKEKSHYED